MGILDPIKRFFVPSGMNQPYDDLTRKIMSEKPVPSSGNLEKIAKTAYDLVNLMSDLINIANSSHNDKRESAFIRISAIAYERATELDKLMKTLKRQVGDKKWRKISEFTAYSKPVNPVFKGFSKINDSEKVFNTLINYIGLFETIEGMANSFLKYIQNNS